MVERKADYARRNSFIKHIPISDEAFKRLRNRGTRSSLRGTALVTTSEDLQPAEPQTKNT